MADEPIKVLVTKREDSPPPAVLPTPPGSQDIEVMPTPAWQMVLVRALRTAIQSFLASVGTIQAINIMDGTALPAFKLAVVGSLAAAGLSALQNILELTAKWDQVRPGMRG